MSAKTIDYDLSHAPAALWMDPDEYRDAIRPWLVTEADADGEQSARCPLHADRRPSASVNFVEDVWHCHAGCGGGPVGALVQRIIYGGTVGTAPDRKRLGKPAEKAPTPSAAAVEGWHSALLTHPDAEPARTYLTESRGITERTWKEHLLGWDGECIMFPVLDADGAVVNVRRRRPRPGANVIGLKGHGTAHLYPAVTELPDDGPAFIVEGELDALVLREHGFHAFTCIGGAGRLGKVIEEHADAFAPLDVAIWTDADEQGRSAAVEVQRVLNEAGGEPTVITWPDETPPSFDVSDLRARDPGRFVERVERLLASELADAPDDDPWEDEVSAELHRLHVREAARERFRIQRARERGTAPPELADIPDALDWIAVEDTDPVWRVERLMEVGHNVLLGGKDKSGKTTLAIDLAISLTTGEPTWLGEFTVTPSPGKVGWINCEMTDRQFRRWLQKAGPDPSRLAVLNLRGNVPNLLDPMWASRITEWMQREHVTFLIVDSLTEIVTAAGLDEDKEGVEVLMALNRLREQTDLSELLVLAHFGHHAERVRGTSKFGGWVDVKMSYVKDAEERRYLSADGRLDDVVREGQVMRGGDGRLMFQPDVSRAQVGEDRKREAAARKAEEDAALRDTVLKVVGEEPGCSSTRLRTVVRSQWQQTHESGPSNDRIDQARDALAADGDLVVEQQARGAGTACRHYLPDHSPDGATDNPAGPAG